MGSNAKEVALAQNLAIMTRAVELYKAEHLGAPPTAKAQLLRFSDEDGNVNATRSYPYLLGPYLHKMPALPMGTNKGETDIVATGSPGDTDTAGWWINPTTGDVRANAPDTDLVADGGKLNELVVSAFKR